MRPEVLFHDDSREQTLVPYWFLNYVLANDELRRQMDDFETHGVYGFISHPRLGLPEDTGFMSPRYLTALKVCAAAKGMRIYLPAFSTTASITAASVHAPKPPQNLILYNFIQSTLR